VADLLPALKGEGTCYCGEVRGKYSRTLALAAVLLLLTCLTQVLGLSCPALYEEREVVIVAVTSLPNGSYAGVAARLRVAVSCPGSGRVFVETLPLSQLDLQASTRVAAQVASRAAGVRFDSCDFYASFRASSPIVGGPSASAATAVAFAAALLRLPLRGDVVMTGMVLPDGSIGPVGGLRAKLEAAASAGAKVFLVPYGQTTYVEYTVVTRRVGPVTMREVRPVTVDLVEYGRSLGVDVRPAATVYEALHVFTGGAYPLPRVVPVGELTRAADSVVRGYVESWARAMAGDVEEAVALGDAIRGSVLSSLPYYTRVYVQEVLTGIERNLQASLGRAREVESRGYYYSAASYYFQALVYALWRYYLLSSLRREGSLDSVRANVSSRVLSVLSAIRGMVGGRSSLSIWELDAAIAAADRAYEALLYLNTSQSQSSVDSATYYLALASSRARTAELWLSLVGAAAPPGPSGSISTEALSETSTSLEYLLDNILAYILSFQGSVSIPSDTFNEMVSRLGLAKTAGDPVEKLALEVSALAYGYVTLVRMFTQDPNATTEVLSRSIGVLASGDLLNRTPTSLVLYLEFAEVQEDPVQRVYTLARVAALASFYVDALRPRVAAEYASTTRQAEVGTAVPRTITVVVTATEGAGRSTATYFLSGVAVGVLVSVALFLVATLASRRSRRL
jgi:uncharacterized protein